MNSYKVRPAVPEEVKKSLAPFSPLTQSLLFARGVENISTAEKFFSPSYENDLHDPFLLIDMDKAVERILSAIDKKEKILIYSDYDADGIPGGVILRDFFDKIGHANVENYIPHRHDEGYGVHLEAIDSFIESKINLLITVDCGIVDFESIDRAQKSGVDVIVTDHHEPNGELPKALAIINHKRHDCTYPEKNLCGTGVVFKLIQALLQKRNFLKTGHEKWFLDLVGIATLSDMVPLLGENRVLAHFGLKVLKKSPRHGLEEMWKKLRVKRATLSEDDIGFSLAPRINAASRMGHPMDGFKLLYTKDSTEASETAEYLNKINDERKGVVASIVKEIKKHLHIREAQGKLPNVLVFGNPEWRPSLLGLVANSIVEDAKRPVFLWGRNGDSLLKGSCRSDGKTNLVALMEKAKHVFTQFGGHKMAGGFAISHESVHTLEQVLNEVHEYAKDDEEIVAWIDSELKLSQISWNLYKEISKFAPFGVGNEKPTFLLKDTFVSRVRQFGKEENHLEILLGEEEKKVKAIKFFSKPESLSKIVSVGKRHDIVANVEKSDFGYYPELRLRIVDII